MSRPQKMHKPLKGSFTDIINAVADGRGIKQSPPKRPTPKDIVKASEPPKPPPPPKP